MAHVSILTIVCVALELQMKTGLEYYATSQFASKVQLFLDTRIEIFLSVSTNQYSYLFRTVHYYLKCFNSDLIVVIV